MFKNPYSLSSIALVSILRIDSLRDRIQMKNETIELLRAKLKEKEK